MKALELETPLAVWDGVEREIESGASWIIESLTKWLGVAVCLISSAIKSVTAKSKFVSVRLFYPISVNARDDRKKYRRNRGLLRRYIKKMREWPSCAKSGGVVLWRGRDRFVAAVTSAFSRKNSGTYGCWFGKGGS